MSKSEEQYRESEWEWMTEQMYQMNEQKEQDEYEEAIAKAQADAELPLLTEEELARIERYSYQQNMTKLTGAEREMLSRLIDTARQYRKATELAIRLLGAWRVELYLYGFKMDELGGEAFEEWKRHTWEQGIL